MYTHLLMMVSKLLQLSRLDTLMPGQGGDTQIYTHTDLHIHRHTDTCNSLSQLGYMSSIYNILHTNTKNGGIHNAICRDT